jgi:hypothetical protein
MKSIILLALMAASPLTLAAEAKWESLFNGKDLTGWSPKIRGCEAGENFKNTFRVADGVIKVDYSDYEQWDKRFGHLFYEKKILPLPSPPRIPLHRRADQGRSRLGVSQQRHHDPQRITGHHGT